MSLRRKKREEEQIWYVREHQVLFWILGYSSEDVREAAGDFDLNLKRERRWAGDPIFWML